ncbi:MAG: transposase [Propionibacteriaceae bacterium]|jgi:REP element-mobilizing transposase RayT|nr:transposase [Propionibacteriaceae bacterium]
MARRSRVFCATGLYHVIFRGVNHCQLFEEDEDFEKLLDLIGRAKVELGMEIYAYCLMSNHAHFLLRERTQADLVTAMRRTLGPYATWFNKKYERSGALITNRYKSEPVTDDGYLLTVVRYIHSNPIEAGITTDHARYRWSSYRDYTTGQSSLTDTDFVLSMFGPDPSDAISRFVEFHRGDCSDDIVNLPRSTKRKPDEQIRIVLASTHDGLVPAAVNGLLKTKRDAILGFLRAQGFSTRQIERVTGIPRGIVSKCQPVTTPHPG